MEAASRAVGTALDHLFRVLDIDRAHIVAGRLVLTDWLGLVSEHSERVASLTLISPLPVDPPMLQPLGSRLLLVTGDQGQPAENVRRLLTALPEAACHILRDYASFPWSDVMADRSAEIAPALLNFLNVASQGGPVAPVSLPEQHGEAAGISYHIRGSGPPLVLMPLDLAPSQWEPLIPLITAHYCTITLGGPMLGPPSLLEGRGRSNYLNVVRGVLDAARIQPAEAILEVGPGSGVVVRELARRTAGANPIISVDINEYLLREALSLAKREGLSEMIDFREGSAEALPLAGNTVDVALSFTVMEEGNADRMLAELVRVTRPGGRVAVIVRAVDVPAWVNLPLSAALRAKTQRPGLFGSGMSEGGCADASLYSRFSAAGLTELTFFPQFAAVTPAAEAVRLDGSAKQILASLNSDETADWQEAMTKAKANGTFFIAMPHHCAIGTKPR
jgi:SAM-dependent methyltransferase